LWADARNSSAQGMVKNATGARDEDSISSGKALKFAHRFLHQHNCAQHAAN
jgi:hypothetical protein